ncbi:MAG: hypothetical protein MJZ81_06170 [Bacteroidales bacterium]|nr:hypothetical protein [Bacteroidales bacterium]
MKAEDCKIGQVVFQKNSGYKIQITTINPPYVIGKKADGQFHESDICENYLKAIVG